MKGLKNLSTMFIILSMLLIISTILLFNSRLQVLLLCTSISSVLVTIVLKAAEKSIKEEIDELSRKIIMLETAVMKINKK
jgi:membrane protein implicated in regulation of membrane protease activity